MSFVIPEGYTLEQGLAAVGPGWKGLVKQAFEAIPPGHVIVQVKEKFGRLRIYFELPGEAYKVGVGAEEFHEVLNSLEDESSRICEQCGQPGELQGPGYLMTLCQPCRAALRAKRDADLKAFKEKNG